MRLDISAGGLDVVVSRATQERSRRSPQGRSGHRCRVQGSELVAMIDPGVERTKVSTAEQPRVTPRPARHGSHAGHHSVEVTTPPPPTTNRAYAGGICEGIAVRAGELSVCVGRICVVSAGGAYALALLVIGALGESVWLSDKTKPGR